MDKMKITRYGIWLLTVLSTLYSLTGCTRRDLLEGSDKVPFKIMLDWGTYSKPLATGYLFYDDKGSAPLYLEGTADGFEGYLLPGIYRIGIFNTDPVNASLQNNGNHEDDCFVANGWQSRSTPDIIESVSNVYGTGITEVTIPRSAVEPIVQKAKPVELVRRVTYILDVGSVGGIKSLEVYQGGAIIDKRIVSNKPYTGNSAALLRKALLNKDGFFETQLSVFDFVGPCQLTITATFEDGTTASTTPIDMTEDLINQPEDDITINLVLQLEDINDEVKAAVKIHGWKTGGSGEIIIQ